MTNWAHDAIFYHIYPLGMLGAPHQNDGTGPETARLAQLHPWIAHLQALGVNALYLGPVFESGSHGYDTTDYSRVDRRLGNNATLAELVAALHNRGIRVILDGVFNHVGRSFPAFRDLQQHGAQSAYRDWFAGIDFTRRSPYGDPFAYEGWSGHYDLVKLNLRHPAVRAHLFAAVQGWVEEFGIDGLRLDAADAIELDFLRDLADHCRRLRPDFWLMGEVVHGDYRRWANPNTLDATTNYECYKGLYSSHNDGNYYEIAYALNRQFGEGGIYRGLPLYAFADNHDVSRVASLLKHPAHLYPLYALLFTMPGVPSLYYGSEWGLGGVKGHDDWPLRPPLTHLPQPAELPHPALADVISRLSHIRHSSVALRRGAYQQLHVAHEQLAFARRHGQELAVVAVNASAAPTTLDLAVPLPDGQILADRLAPHERLVVRGGRLKLGSVPPHGARILTTAGPPSVSAH